MSRRLPLTIVASILAIVLALLACGLPQSQPVTEVPAAATSTPETEPVVFDPPAAGERMLWTDSSTVVYVPGESFVMGQDEKEPSDHSPAHTVTLSPFWIYQAEVTNRMYRTCVELGVCTAPTQSLWYPDPKYENAPVSGVDWDHAKAYCEWMDARLPTEAEWELAARGTQTDPYPWGKDEPTCDLLNFLDCLVPSVPDAVRSYPLGASPYKVADLAGNVSEWVSDWYARDYYSTSPASDPAGPAEGKNRVVRGSSYLSPLRDTEVYLRGSANPLQSQPTVGFRCVVNSDAPGVAPMCDLLSFDPSWEPLGTPQPLEKQGTAEDHHAYCYGPPEDPVYSESITASFHIKYYLNGSRGSITVTSPQGGVSCVPQSIGCCFATCSGPAFQPGQPVTLTFCMMPNVPASVAPVCPSSYEYDPAASLCEYKPGPGGGQCSGGIVVEGYGCLYPPDDGLCPAGHYLASYNGDPVCVPAGGPASPDPDHPLAACPAGLVFNEGNLCCEYPPDVSPVCPVGFTLDEVTSLCAPMPNDWCFTISDVVPDCEPTPEPPPEQQTGCWRAVLGPPRCVSPCPVGVPNTGPCTP